MEGFLRFVGVAIAAAVIALTLRGGHKEIGAAFSLLAGIALLLALADKLRDASDTLEQIAGYADVDNLQLSLILKLLGVSFVAEFAAQACRDAGEEGIALRVELGGKLMLLLLSAPLIKQVAQLIVELTL